MKAIACVALLILIAACAKPETAGKAMKATPPVPEPAAPVETQPSATAPTSPAAVCTDSDGGIKQETKGSVTLANSKEEISDECAGPFLSEQYCEGDEARTKNIRCSKECKDGACV